MNDKLLIRLFSCPEEAKAFWAHRVSLEFQCPRCGQDVYKSMLPAAFGRGPTLYTVSCGCAVEGYADDFTTPEHWANVVGNATGSRK
jgi:hypothetical protein